METLQFTIPEILSLIGLVQCVYILVYMGMRAGRLSRATLPIIYFSFLGMAFLLDFASLHLSALIPYYSILQWFFWFSGPPLSVLLVIQIAQITRMPPLKSYWVLGLVPFALLVSCMFTSSAQECTAMKDCTLLHDWLNVTGLITGGMSLLTVWLWRGLFRDIQAQKAGKDRYWLILSLIFTNIAFLMVILLDLSRSIDPAEASLVRTVLGLALAYLTSTSLFRIYPQAVQVSPREEGLSEADRALALRIEHLMDMDKVYQEAAYSRSDLARELGEAETTVSKVINLHFRKTFPQLLSERRIEDAKRLLVETQANVKTIAEEVGFNSLASFNRVFKDLTGEAPSAYRKNHKP